MRRAVLCGPSRQIAALVGALLMLAVLIAGCGGSSTDSTDSSGSSGSTSAEVASSDAQPASDVGEGLPQNTAGAIKTLPPELRPYYKGLTEGIGPSGLIDFKSPAEPPYVIGYASTYEGNSWRGTVLEYLEDTIIPKYEELGLVKELIVTQSENDVPTQIQNEKQLVDKGADGLITCCPPPGLEKSVEDSNSKGVPFVSIDGGVATPDSLNTGVNYYLAGYQEAQGLAREIGGEGNVVLVSGIQGTNASDQFDAGAEKALEEFPGIEITGTVAGNWTDPIAKAELLKFLGTHPEPLAGVVAQAANETGVLQALQQSGREVPPITIGGEIGPMCYWKNHPTWLEQGYQMWPPRAEIDLGIRSLLKTMLGQGPKIETIARPQFTVTLEEAEELLPPNCSESDPGWLPFYGEEWMPEEELEGYFENPFPLSEWKSHTGA